MIKRPNQERFNMSQEEAMTFWLIIIAEYSHSEVRRDSLLLVNNHNVRTEDA